eukprot:755348-Hanusia_phi.AAC.8
MFLQLLKRHAHGDVSSGPTMLCALADFLSSSLRSADVALHPSVLISSPYLFIFADVLQASKDVASILKAEKSHAKSSMDPNEMAALALTFNPKFAMSASKLAASGNWAKTDKLVQESVPGAKIKAGLMG